VLSPDPRTHAADDRRALTETNGHVIHSVGRHWLAREFPEIAPSSSLAGTEPPTEAVSGAERELSTESVSGAERERGGAGEQSVQLNDSCCAPRWVMSALLPSGSETFAPYLTWISPCTHHDYIQENGGSNPSRNRHCRPRHHNLLHPPPAPTPSPPPPLPQQPPPRPTLSRSQLLLSCAHAHAFSCERISGLHSEKDTS
jgi:hypothetical protein